MREKRLLANGSSRQHGQDSAWSRDLGRAIDYLETRSDIDRTRLAFYGVSAGADDIEFFKRVQGNAAPGVLAKALVTPQAPTGTGATSASVRSSFEASILNQSSAPMHKTAAIGTKGAL